MRRFEYTRPAKRDLARLPEDGARAVADAVKAYASSSLGDVKKLKGYTPPTWRLRVGRFRVLFQLEGPTLVVTGISERRDAYR